jgi:hypothetical protein
MRKQVKSADRVLVIANFDVHGVKAEDSKILVVP